MVYGWDNGWFLIMIMIASHTAEYRECLGIIIREK